VLEAVVETVEVRLEVPVVEGDVRSHTNEPSSTPSTTVLNAEAIGAHSATVTPTTRTYGPNGRSQTNVNSWPGYPVTSFKSSVIPAAVSLQSVDDNNGTCRPTALMHDMVSYPPVVRYTVGFCDSQRAKAEVSSEAPRRHDCMLTTPACKTVRNVEPPSSMHANVPW
jgi:hypothetical protein